MIHPSTVAKNKQKKKALFAEKDEVLVCSCRLGEKDVTRWWLNQSRWHVSFVISQAVTRTARRAVNPITFTDGFIRLQSRHTYSSSLRPSSQSLLSPPSPSSSLCAARTAGAEKETRYRPALSFYLHLQRLQRPPAEWAAFSRRGVKISYSLYYQYQSRLKSVNLLSDG